MGIQSVDHFELVVSDVTRAIDFYKGLGFDVDEGTDRGDSKRRPVLKIGPAQQINIVSPEFVKGLGREVTAGGAHFCLVWNGTMEEVVSSLSSRGVTPRRGPVSVAGSKGQATSVYFNDPDDNSVEIMVYG